MLSCINRRVGLVGPLNLAGPCHQVITTEQKAASRRGDLQLQHARCASSRSAAAAHGAAAGFLSGWGGSVRTASFLTKGLLGTANSREIPPAAQRSIIAETRLQINADPWKFGILGQVSESLAEYAGRGAVALGCSPAAGQRLQAGCLMGAAAACQLAALIGVVLRSAAVIAAVVPALVWMVARSAHAAVMWPPLRWETAPAAHAAWRADLAQRLGELIQSDTDASRRAFDVDVLRQSITVDDVPLVERKPDVSTAAPHDSEKAIEQAAQQLAVLCNHDVRMHAALMHLLTQATPLTVLQAIRPLTLGGEAQTVLSFHAPLANEFTVKSLDDGVRVDLRVGLKANMLLAGTMENGACVPCADGSVVNYELGMILRPDAQGGAPTLEVCHAQATGDVHLLPPDAPRSEAQESFFAATEFLQTHELPTA